MPKETKVIARRKKFLEIEIPSIEDKVEIMANSPSEINGKIIKLDLTRQLKGKSLESTFRIKLENNKPVAYPFKIKLMPYFIRRMIRKRISYVEDSFQTPSQESMLKVKPFLITRKRVSKAVRRTLRNKAKNWLEDYFSQKKDTEIFDEILSNKAQKALSLMLKKTYPLSLCEIRVLEVTRSLKLEEVPKLKENKEIALEKQMNALPEKISGDEEGIIKEAQDEIKKTQEKAIKKEKEIKEENSAVQQSEAKTERQKKERKKKTEEEKEKKGEEIEERKKV